MDYAGRDIALRCPPDAAARRPYQGYDRARLCRARGETRQTFGGSTESRPTALRFSKIAAAGFVFNETAVGHVAQVVDLMRRIRAYLKAGPLSRARVRKTMRWGRAVAHCLRFIDRRANNGAGVRAD